MSRFGGEQLEQRMPSGPSSGSRRGAGLRPGGARPFSTTSSPATSTRSRRKPPATARCLRHRARSSSTSSSFRGPGRMAATVLDVDRAVAADLTKRLELLQIAGKGRNRGPDGQARDRRRMGWSPAACGRARHRAGSAARRPRLARNRHRQRRAWLRRGYGGRLSRPPHRARRSGRRQGFFVRRDLPPRGADGSAPRRRLRQGLLCRPGGRLPHAASGHRPYADRAGASILGRSSPSGAPLSRPARRCSARRGPALRDAAL